MSSLSTPVPSNLRLRKAGKMTQVESDIFNVCERIKEIDSRLSIVLQEGHPKPWVVMELGPDGEERFVSRYEELDARILEDLRYMLAVPFEKRLEVLQRKVDAENDARGRMSDEQFERFSRDFYDAGVKSGIINPSWSKNYPLSARKMKKKPGGDG